MNSFCCGMLIHEQFRSYVLFSSREMKYFLNSIIFSTLRNDTLHHKLIMTQVCGINLQTESYCYKCMWFSTRLKTFAFLRYVSKVSRGNSLNEISNLYSDLVFKNLDNWDPMIGFCFTLIKMLATEKSL